MNYKYTYIHAHMHMLTEVHIYTCSHKYTYTHASHQQKQGMTTFASPFGTVHADTHADQLESESSISDSSFGKGIALSKILAEKLSVTGAHAHTHTHTHIDAL